MIEFQNICKNVVEDIPDVIIIGNIAYDIVDYSKVDGRKETSKCIGGAAIFSAIPASLYYRVGIVGKVGTDFDISKLYGYNIDFRGIKVIQERTTVFYTVWNSNDGQDRNVFGDVSTSMSTNFEDIPLEFLKAKHFHLTTANPKIQLDIIKKLRKQTNATISVDTIQEFSTDKYIKEVFDNVDIAFIDKEFSNLLNCNAPIKIIKLGKKGCKFVSKQQEFTTYSNIINNVVDKTGAGDCLNGVFINLIMHDFSEQDALKKAVDIATESIKRHGIIGLKRQKTKLEKDL